MSTLPEDSVLQVLDPVPEDVNEWPDFALKEVKIFYQGKSRYADLLEAGDDTPLCVVGELMPLEDEQEHLALIDNPAYKRVKIDHVTNYSFGQDDYGRPVIWAAGKAGWYEISPSARYIEYYENMVEAIDLFYFMVDQFSRLSLKRRRLGFQIDPFLREYQKHTDYRVDDDDEAIEILHKHHKFILKQMVEEREGIDWSQTHLFKHLAETYADVISDLRAKLAAQLRQNQHEEFTPSADDERSAHSESESPDAASSPAADVQVQRSRSSSIVSNESAPTASSDEAPVIDYTRPVWNLLNVLRKTPSFDIKNAGLEEVAREVSKLLGVSSKTVMKCLTSSAEEFLRLMNEARVRKKFNWSTRNIYSELEATFANDIAEHDVEMIKAPAKHAQKKHRLKSVLRPSIGGKTNKRMKHNHQRDADVEEEDDDADMDAEMQDAPALQRNGVRTPSGKKHAHRMSSDMDSPSRQLNGHGTMHIHGDEYTQHTDSLPPLPPAPEARDLIEIMRTEAKKQGRVHQVSHLEAFLNGFSGDLL